MTINEFCRETRNYFDYDRREAEYTISGGTFTLDDMQNGQYFRIAGSVFNDGVYTYPVHGLINETFKGVIWYMAVPYEIVQLVDEISEWEEKNGTIVNGPYRSESFGGYTYTKETGAGGGAYTWKDAFKAKLDRWRKICPY